MADPKNKWTQPGAPPAPMFFGKKERGLVKQINDELAERILGQPIAYYPISLEESNFNDTYGEATEKISLPPVRVYAYVTVENEQTNDRYGYEYQTKLTVNFSEKRLTADQNLYVRVGDFIQYGDLFYEIVRTYNDTRYYFGQVEHKFQISAECVRARQGAFRVTPALDRVDERAAISGEGDQAAPRAVPYPPLAASYITVTPDRKLPNERVLTAGSGITIVDSGAGGAITVSAAGANAQGITGSLQLQAGAGNFSGSSNLVFLTSSNRLGINTDTPTHSLTILGDISASADVLIGGDLRVKGTLIGSSPLKVLDSIAVYNDGGDVVARLGSSSFGANSLSASFGGFNNLSASANVSASYFYGDARYLTGVTASAAAVADGPIGSLQFREDLGGEISGSSKVLYDISNNRLTIAGGLIHNRTTVAASHTASVSDYILGATTLPSNILVDATLFNVGQVLLVKDETGTAAAATPVTITPSGSQTVDGMSSLTIESPHGSVLVYSDGANWFIY